MSDGLIFGSTNGSAIGRMGSLAQGGETQGADKRQLAKLVDGARQFEAMMLEQLLKPLNFGESPDAGGEESSGGAGGTIRGFGTEAIAKAIAGKGGFGMAEQIIRQVTSEHMSRGKRELKSHEG